LNTFKSCATVHLNTFNRGAAVPRQPRTPASERTRQAILETALRLFRERGYDGTTMRAIAESAGVSLGNAYYYFGSKEHLVQEFYAGIQAAHRDASADALTARSLAERLRRVLHAGIEVMAPYHDFAAAFVKVALDPTSPSSPFSRESLAAREAATGLFRDVVQDARPAVDRQIREVLPELLWLGYLGVTLFWAYDRSSGQARTHELIDRTSRLVGRLVRLARLPGAGAATRELVALVRSLSG
jgi:AcrR family transcriptional regulator